jgi:hypothetical protein
VLSQKKSDEEEEEEEEAETTNDCEQRGGARRECSTTCAAAFKTGECETTTTASSVEEQEESVRRPVLLLSRLASVRIGVLWSSPPLPPLARRGRYAKKKDRKQTRDDPFVRSGGGLGGAALLGFGGLLEKKQIIPRGTQGTIRGMKEARCRGCS